MPTHRPKQAAPLTGYRVLDMSRVLAGPWAGQVLADLGAEVIKVERPGSGDDTRHWGPPWLRDKDGRETDISAYYMAANRGKSSVTLDIASTGGQAVIDDLAKVSDVLIENYKVGGLKKYRLDYQRLSALNPRLVYCSITGFGQTGPLRDRAGYDILIQGMGGLMSITGEADKKPGGGPQKVGVAIADLFAGLYASVAIQGALLERERSGLGQHIDISLLDVQTAMLANQATNYLIGGTVPGRMGTEHPNIAPYQVFETKDGHIVLAVGNDSQFKKFAAISGAPALATDDRFSTNAGRVTHRETLVETIAGQMKLKTSAEWLALLEREQVPCGPINRIDEVFQHPQIAARGMRMSVAHPVSGQCDLVASPIRYSRSDAQSDKAPPQLGADTSWVLRDLLGYDDERIDALRREQVI